MKKIDVIVKDRNTLILESDALKGDYIDLTRLSNVDFSMIESLIESGKDRIYESKLNDLKKTFLLESENKNLQLKKELENKIVELNNTILELTKEKENSLKVKELELNNIHQKEINDLNYQLETLKREQESILNSKISDMKENYNKTISDLNYEIQNLKKENLDALKVKELELNSIHQKEINDLTHQLNVLKAQHEDMVLLKLAGVKEEYTEKINNLTISKEKEISDLSMKLEKLKAEYAIAEEKKAGEFNKVINDLKIKYQNEINEKENTIHSLQRQKASLNVKQTGEDLESWCNNEMISYMQNGLFNCTWSKDNLVVKEDGEVKGSKADYIFKIYADSSHKEEELLAGVCLDMKDENPDSINKKKNADYYKDLDKNRNKKNCKYAVLVSNLELDKPNDLPIYKVLEYKDMYVVRPAYMITLLNLLASLSKRFADLILADSNEKLELKNSRELMEEFDDLKKTYLDKPLEKLGKDIESIKNSNDSILKASRKIDELCDSITRSYVGQIKDKLEKFEIKLSREYKKYVKKEEKIVVSD